MKFLFTYARGRQPKKEGVAYYSSTLIYHCYEYLLNLGKCNRYVNKNKTTNVYVSGFVYLD